MLGWLVLFSVFLGGLFIYLGTGGEDLAHTSTIGIAGVVAVMLLALYAMATRKTSDGSNRLRRLVSAVIPIGAGIATWFAFGSSLDFKQLLPSRSPTTTPTTDRDFDPAPGSLKSVFVRKDAQGRFVTRGAVNGAPLDLLIDTGASTVLLRQSDAERAGIDTATLDYSVPVATANGQENAAAVRLRNLTIGAIRIDDVEALVAKPGSLNENLLGMSFLRRLRSYGISGDFMTLRE